MKIDLNELERKARDDRPIVQDGRPHADCEDCGVDYACDAHRAGVAHPVFTIGAPTTLALIARVRKLESGLRELLVDPLSLTRKQICELLDKGAVLP